MPVPILGAEPHLRRAPYPRRMPLSTPSRRRSATGSTRAFEEPTPAQAQAWPAIATGEHALISAPDRLGQDAGRVPVGARPARRRADAEDERTRLVYVSPLKALSYDVEKNLRAPLRGIGARPHASAIRTGDTPQKERRDMVRHPPDILITTPESLYLMLTSQAREIFARHRVGDRRRDPRRRADEARRAPRAHARAARRAGRARRRSGSGCPRRRTRSRRSAASSSARSARCTIVDTGVRKPLDLKIHVPVESHGRARAGHDGAELDPFAGGEATRKSIWPAIYPELLAARARAPLDDRLRQQPPRAPSGSRCG